jgi:hypothetical protein
MLQGGPLANTITTRLLWNQQSISLQINEERINCHFSGPGSISNQAIKYEITDFFQNRDGSRPFKISDLIIGDDRIAIPLLGEPDQIMPSLNAIIENLLRIQISENHITLLCHPSLAEALSSTFNGRFQIVLHDPSAEADRAYLASTASGSRIYLNRHLLDHDIVLPLIVAEPISPEAGLGYLSTYWPGFGDISSINAIQAQYQSNQNNARREIREAVWLSGLHCILAAIPARDKGIASISLFEPMKMQNPLNTMINEIWQIRIPAEVRQALLIAGNDAHPNLNISQFTQFCRSTAKIAGKCSKTAVSFQLDDHLINEIQDSQTSDLKKCSWYKSLAKAAEICRLYALSNLPSHIADDLEMITLESPDELSRLLDKSSDWAFIEDAERTRIIFE